MGTHNFSAPPSFNDVINYPLDNVFDHHPLLCLVLVAPTPLGIFPCRFRLLHPSRTRSMSVQGLLKMISIGTLFMVRFTATGVDGLLTSFALISSLAHTNKHEQCTNDPEGSE
jgi:hypothetical protein